jgi:hypothetical protein
MRISIFRDDPGFTEQAYQYHIFVDGVERTDCFTADEEEGKAWAYIDIGGGIRQTDPETGELVLQEITGVVLIRR